MAAVLGFLCEVGDKLIDRQRRRGGGNNSRVAVDAGEPGEMKLDYEVAGVQPSREANIKVRRSYSSCSRDPSFRANSLLWTHSESPGVGRKRASTNATDFETAACQALFPPRASVGRSGFLSSMSSRKLTRGPTLHRPVHHPPTAPHAGTVPLHWSIALAALVELVLSAFKAQQTEP